MSRAQILNTFKVLSRSQGFYGRILEELNSMSDGAYDGVMSELEAQNFSDAVDLIMYIEG